MSTYKIVEELGRGGMGVVYRALHPALNREVAIKFLLDDAGGLSEVMRSRFRREMEVLMKLSHPSIIKVYDAGEADGRLYYVMELLRARDLQWHLKRRGRLPTPVALSVLDQLLDALDYIHESGVLHRDIKPSNVVLEDTGRATLMDFGVVRKSGATLLTQEGHAVGTPRYFSPEMIQKGESSPASDQFSLGVVAYELLTACPPFGGESLAEVAHAIMKLDPLPLAERCRELPAEVAPVIMRMLAKNPDDRWPGMGAARAALQAALAAPGDSVRLGETSIVPLPPAPPASRPTGKRAVPVAPRVLITQSSLSREAATRRLRNGLALCVGLGVLIVAPLVRWLTPRGGITTIAGPGGPRASEVTVKRVGLDRLRVEFATADASRWALERGHGPEAAERADAKEHALELKTSPWQAEDSLTLVSGARRVELIPPRSLAELVHRLRAATRSRELSKAGLDQVWMAIRGDLIKTVTRLNSRTFRAAIERAPETRARFEEHVEKVRRSRGLNEVLKQLAPHVASLLMSADTPMALRNELLEALWPIDNVDALASWLALPSPFGVQRMLAPAIEIGADISGDDPVPAGKTHPLTLAPDPAGIVLVLPTEIPMGSDGMITASDTLLIMRAATKGRRSTYEGTFSNADAAPAAARRFLFELQALDPNIYLVLKPPGFEVALPIRPPDAVAPPSGDKLWLMVTLRGALAGRGAWKVKQERAFAEQSRIYLIVDRVVEEELGEAH